MAQGRYVMDIMGTQIGAIDFGFILGIVKYKIADGILIRMLENFAQIVNMWEENMILKLGDVLAMLIIKTTVTR